MFHINCAVCSFKLLNYVIKNTISLIAYGKESVNTFKNGTLVKNENAEAVLQLHFSKCIVSYAGVQLPARFEGIVC